MIEFWSYRPIEVARRIRHKKSWQFKLLAKKNHLTSKQKKALCK